ncbi:hypothetical protein OIE63_00485 [Streptomyces sp. NBC_01795]|uniref:hypothetical protein n=1 Tax=unclassified Streptomyces TaxID=2593676 RepID=UPI002DD9472D|nr:MULTISPECIES: hypothetical protein [unclassified Streptomyces]WSA90174.1 hypothetical protein OIE63_00485 [Streptomyces sp. NBC_01795]WSB74403.1 hypothetical protein OHB04_00485 [Streptomyces sp. NBC_01775]WSS17215.1 hypothetical protein OG533_38915 [Streptomyces sp. NBC_01186]
MDASWLRGFVPVHAQKDLGAQQHRAIDALLSASQRGYGTILSLKPPHNGKPFPRPTAPR